VIFVEHLSRFNDLVAKIEESRPGLLHTVTVKNNTPAVNASATQDAASKVEEGLTALIEALRSPVVHQAILFFQADFVLAQSQIQWLQYLKRLQDPLQDLQNEMINLNRHYSDIKQAKLRSENTWSEFWNTVRRFAAGPTSSSDSRESETLVQCIAKTTATLDDILNMAQNSPGVLHEAMWVDKLAQARDDLKAVVNNFDPQRMDDAIEWIGHVLNHQPDRIHDWIIATVGVLLESKLILRMREVYTRLVELNVSPKTLQRFADLVDSLPQLQVTLTALVAGHFGWQAIYREIDQILCDPETSLGEFEQEWRTLSLSIQRLVGQSNTEPWVADLTATANEITYAFSIQSFVNVKNGLSRYQEKARLRFLKVEEALVQLSSELQGIGARLNDLLMMLAQ